MNDKLSQVDLLLNYYRGVAEVLGRDKDGGEKQAGYSLLWFYKQCCNSLNPLSRAYLGDEEAYKSLFDDGSNSSSIGIDSHLVEGKYSLNDSQKKAISNALSHPISFVQGPPGTGKTETILNMVSCILAQGKNVAVVSRNGAALDNIKVKVDEYSKQIKEQPNKKKVVESFAKLGNAKDRNKWSDSFLDYNDKRGKLEHPQLKIRGWEPNICAADFLEEKPFITSTIHSLKKCFADGDTFPFDYVIIDEASQCDILTGLVAMSSAKHLILVGDKEQLSPIYNEEFDKELNQIYNEECDEKLIQSSLGELKEKYGMKDSNRGEGHSFLESCFKVFNASENKNVPETFLNVHYRCHPGIIQFCKDEIYDKDGNHELDISVSGEKDNTGKLIPPDKTPIKILWFRGDYCESCQKEGSSKSTKRNMKQISIFMEEEWPVLKERLGDNRELSVCILSPFQGQLEELKKKLEEDGFRDVATETILGDNFSFDVKEKKGASTDGDDDFTDKTPAMLTIHKSQGQEFDVVYLLPVEDGDWEWPWSQGQRLINVAVSRAKKELRVILSSCLMEEGTQKELTGDSVSGKRSQKIAPEEREKEKKRQKLLRRLVDYVRDRTWPESPAYLGEEGFPRGANEYGFHETKLRSIFDDTPKKNQEKSGAKDWAPEMCFNAVLDEKWLQKDGIDYRRNVLLKEIFTDFENRQFKDSEECTSEEKKDFIRNGAHFDFVFFEKETRQVLLCVEIDGKFHRLNETEQELERQKWCDKCKDLLVSDYGGVVYNTNIRTKDFERDNSPTFIALRLPNDGTTYLEIDELRKCCEDEKIRKNVFTIEDLLDRQKGEPKAGAIYLPEKYSAISLTKLLEKNNMSMLSKDANEVLQQAGYIRRSGKDWLVQEKGAEIGIVQSSGYDSKDKREYKYCTYSPQAEEEIVRYLKENYLHTTR